MRHARKVDGNHKQIREGIRAAGYSVADLSHVGQGVPDLRVRVDIIDGRYKCLYLEVKDGSLCKSAQALTAKEVDWMEHNWANTRVVNSLESALLEIEKYKQGE